MQRMKSLPILKAASLLLLLASGWLLYQYLELGYYRERSVQAHSAEFASGMLYSRFRITEAVNAYADGNHPFAISRLRMAEDGLREANDAGRRYGFALNARFSRQSRMFPLCCMLLAIYANTANDLHWTLERDGELPPDKEEVLHQILADVQLIEDAFPPELLHRANHRDLHERYRALGPDLQLQVARDYMGVDRRR